MELGQQIVSDREIVVRYHAGAAAREKATWGQTLICDDIDSYGQGSSHFNIAGAIVLNPPIDVGALLDVLEMMTVRHQSLRTNFEKTGTGWLQHVRGEGEFSVRVVEVSAVAEDRESLVESLVSDLNRLPYDLLEDHPVRFGAVTERKSVVALGYSLCHSAVDGYGAQLFKRALNHALQGKPDGARSAGSGFQNACEESAFQCSEEGKAVHERAMRHWKHALEQLPEKSVVAEEEEFYDLRLTSNRLAGNAQRIAKAQGISSANVFLAAAAQASLIALADPIFSAQVTVNNRFRPNIKKLIAPVSMEGLLLIDASHAKGFSHLLTEAPPAALRCYLASYFDKRAMLEMAHEIEIARGAEIDMSRWYNDIHHAEDRASEPDGGEPVLAWQRSPNKPVDVSYAMGITGGPGSMSIVLTANIRVIPRRSMEAFLMEIDSMLSAHAAHS